MNYFYLLLFIAASLLTSKVRNYLIFNESLAPHLSQPGISKVVFLNGFQFIKHVWFPHNRWLMRKWNLVVSLRDQRTIQEAFLHTGFRNAAAVAPCMFLSTTAASSHIYFGLHLLIDPRRHSNNQRELWHFCLAFILRQTRNFAKSSAKKRSPSSGISCIFSLVIFYRGVTGWLFIC